MQWKHPGSPLPKKFKKVSSVGKVMASIFWGSQDVIMEDYLVEGCTQWCILYRRTKQLCQEIVTKRKGKLTRGVLLLQDNAQAHTSKVAMAAATKYSSNLPRFSFIYVKVIP